MFARRQRNVVMGVIAGLLAIVTVLPANDFEIQAGWNDQLFPSYLIATATIKLPEEAVEEYEGQEVLGDPQGLLGKHCQAPDGRAGVAGLR